MTNDGTRPLLRSVRDLASAESDSLAPYRERIMLVMGGVTVVLLMPFTINKFVQGRLLVALILVVILLMAFANDARLPVLADPALH